MARILDLPIVRKRKAADTAAPTSLYLTMTKNEKKILSKLKMLVSNTHTSCHHQILIIGFWYGVRTALDKILPLALNYIICHDCADPKWMGKWNCSSIILFVLHMHYCWQRIVIHTGHYSDEKIRFLYLMHEPYHLDEPRQSSH